MNNADHIEIYTSFDGHWGVYIDECFLGSVQADTFNDAYEAALKLVLEIREQRIAELEAALIFYADGIRPLVDADTNTTNFIAPDDGSLGRAALTGEGAADVS